MAIIIKTIKNAMLQDTAAGRIYTSKSPHLTDMNSFVEAFVNAQTISVSSGASRRRPAQIKILVSSDKLENLNEGVTDVDLKDAWVRFINAIRTEAEKTGGSKLAGNKAVEKLTDDDWTKFCMGWVKENSNGDAVAKPADDAGEGEGGEPAGRSARQVRQQRGA